jgi:hypothetical protein
MRALIALIISCCSSKNWLLLSYEVETTLEIMKTYGFDGSMSLLFGVYVEL